MSESASLVNRAINTIRFLSADAVQKANSGHPGLPMGAAAMAYVLWTKHLRFNPANPSWSARDRFILSGGHGSMLLYSLLYLSGFDITLEDLKEFRQWGSKTPGHPEYGLTPGVETTTGPLGQGFANGVGMAIAAEILANEFNRPGHEIIDNFFYAIVTDGDLMEGVASEAASLAGHLKLGRLIYLYDDNHISIDGSTQLAFTEDRAERFRAYGWHVLRVDDGNDTDAIDKAITQAKQELRPSLISCRTVIGYGLPTKQGTAKAHGEPPGEAELRQAKENLGWPTEPSFYIPDDVMEHFRTAISKGKTLEATWKKKLDTYRKEYPDIACEFERRMGGVLPADWTEQLPDFPADSKGLATRAASGMVLNAIAERIPELVGGSADLAPSNKTWIESSVDFQPATRGGRNFHFGVREHGMGAIVNGMALYGGVIPYGGTFLVFSDYMRPSIRLSALSEIPATWVFTHDSIGVGEDGPTHQPVEHLAALRAIPNLVVIRPGDANETVEAWKTAIARRDGPTALIFSRQSAATLDRNIYAPANQLQYGAYILADLGEGDLQIILMASGTELQLIVEAGVRLAAESINVRLISFPSWELFAAQSQNYRDRVLPPNIPTRLAVEAGVRLGWEQWTGNTGFVIGVDRFGASAPYKTLYEKLGLSVDAIIAKARMMLDF